MKLSDLKVLLGVGVVAAIVGCAPAPPSDSTETSAAPAEQDSAEEAATDESMEAPVEEPAAEPTPAAEPKPEPEPTPAAPEKEAASADKSLPTEVVLGDPSLTAGIPGEGPLTKEQIEAWLNTPGVHEPLKIELPLGLSLASQSIQGIEDNPMTRAKIELGRQLYFDGRLSSDGTISCASCHHPDSGYTAHTTFGVGVGGQEGNRNSPVSFNRILSGPQFWDGRAPSLEEQAKGPIANPIEMANNHETCVKTVGDLEGYKMQFEAVFGENSVNIDNIAKAIATFERAIVTGPSPYDYRAAVKPFLDQFPTDEDVAELKEDDPELYERFMALKKDADAHPMSESAIRGQELFFSEKTNCTACHAGANFTDEKYHNLGVGMGAEEPDMGRFVVSGEEADKGAFKTPTVRNIVHTAPYMHDGSVKTLEEVVELYVKGGEANEHLSPKIKKLELSDQDKADLVAFMKALTGEFPPVERGRLPQ